MVLAQRLFSGFRQLKKKGFWGEKNSIIKGLTSLRGFANFGSLSEAGSFAVWALSFSGHLSDRVYKV